MPVKLIICYSTLFQGVEHVEQLCPLYGGDVESAATIFMKRDEKRDVLPMCERKYVGNDKDVCCPLSTVDERFNSEKKDLPNTLM